jgi:hypothetical protein
MHWQHGTWVYALATGAIVALSGCSTGPAVGTVTGEVTFDGQPVKDGHISFTPVDGKGQTGGAPIADGNFRAEQVSATKMKVEIHGNKKTGKKIKAYDTPESPVNDEIVELLPPKFHVNSELTLDVKRGTQAVKYDLKSK